MKIVFTGLPYFGKKLVDDLTQFDKSTKYIFCNTYYNKKDKLKFLVHLFNADLVVSFNGASSNSKALNWVLRFRKKLIMFWHGSDVLTLQKNKANGNFIGKYIENAKSFTDANWLQSELKDLGVNARILQFKFVETTNNLRNFQDVDVLTYCANSNEDFYGYETILNIAGNNPNIIFHIVGSTGDKLKQYSNIKFYGWLSEENFKQLLDKHAIFVRLTNHDGYSLSVLRAIANGNYVLWNNPHEMTGFVSNENDLSLAINNLTENKNTLIPNQRGINWAIKNLNRETILQNFIAEIKKHVN